MNRLNMLAIFVFFVLQIDCFSQIIVQNGDFENDFTGWMEVGTASISSSTFHTGAKALLASDSARLRYSYAYQELSLDYDRHEINFWVYPASSEYYSAFELIANWQSGTAQFITRVLMIDSTLAFTALNVSETIPNTLMQNNWNKVTIQVDKATLKQDFFINDSLVSSLISSSFPTIEHLLVGDLSTTGMYGSVYFDDISISDTLTTDIAARLVKPVDFALKQNYPNPFNPSTTIEYELAKPGQVLLEIYNALGQNIKTLVDEKQLGEHYSLNWDGTNAIGQKVPSGVYLYRIKIDGLVQTRKMLLFR